MLLRCQHKKLEKKRNGFLEYKIPNKTVELLMSGSSGGQFKLLNSDSKINPPTPRQTQLCLGHLLPYRNFIIYPHASILYERN